MLGSRGGTLFLMKMFKKQTVKCLHIGSDCFKVLLRKDVLSFWDRILNCENNLAKCITMSIWLMLSPAAKHRSSSAKSCRSIVPAMLHIFRVALIGGQISTSSVMKYVQQPTLSTLPRSAIMDLHLHSIQTHMRLLCHDYMCHISLLIATNDTISLQSCVSISFFVNHCML